jgi:hypothetical protein
MRTQDAAFKNITKGLLRQLIRNVFVRVHRQVSLWIV